MEFECNDRILTHYHGDEKKVKVPEGITVIYPIAFANCENLTEVILPDSLLAIYGGAFNTCPKLEKIVIPSTVSEIRKSAFSYCPNLKHVRITKGTKYSDFTIDSEFDQNTFRNLRDTAEFEGDLILDGILSRLEALETRMAQMESHPAANTTLERFVRLRTFYPLTETEKTLR